MTVRAWLLLVTGLFILFDVLALWYFARKDRS
jgi:hypothetical protein